MGESCEARRRSGPGLRRILDLYGKDVQDAVAHVLHEVRADRAAPERRAHRGPGGKVPRVQQDELLGVLFILRQPVGQVHKTSGWIELVVCMRKTQPQK